MGYKGRVHKGPYKEDVLVIRGVILDDLGEELDAAACSGLSGPPLRGAAAPPEPPPVSEILVATIALGTS